MTETDKSAMPITTLRKELWAFICSSESRAIVLKGRWGRGKTYFWGNTLGQLPDASTAPWTHYSYVSLFGVGSLDALKDSLFEHARPLNEVIPGEQGLPTTRTAGNAGGFSTKLRQLTDRLAAIGRKGRAVLGEMPALENLTPFIRYAAFATVENHLVCIDDLERRPAGLGIADVLGLVTYLREQRNCRVVLILNTDALEGDPKSTFDGLREKVFDYELEYAPRAADCASLVLPSVGFQYQVASAAAIKLDITNIRVLRRIRRAIDALVPDPNVVEKSVAKSLIESTVLLTWAFNSQAEGAPSLAYIRRFGYGGQSATQNGQERSPDEVRWIGILERFGHRSNDSIDPLICDGLERGYFDLEEIRPLIAAGEEAVRRGKLWDAFFGAWEKVHASFKEDAQQIIDQLVAAFRAGPLQVSANNMDATTVFLRQLGESALADELVREWIEQQAAAHQSGPIDDMAVRFYPLKDPILKAEYEKLQMESRRPQALDVALARLGENAWDERDEAALADATPEEVVDLLLSMTDGEFNEAIKRVLQLGRADNAAAHRQRAAKNMETALETIAASSALNALRVQRFGIPPGA